MAALTCAACGLVAQGSDAFCRRCGASAADEVSASRAERPCGRCGAANPLDTNFCHSCGGRLEPHLPAAALPETAERAPPGRASLTYVRPDGTDGLGYSIDDDPFDIGRTAGHLRFDDPHLDPRHARLRRSGAGYVLAPLEARNGVFLRLRAPAALEDGDTLLIGKEVLRFERPTPGEQDSAPAVEHGVALFGTPLRPWWGRLRQVSASGVAADVFHLFRDEMVLGREQGDIVFTADEFLSRRHAAIACYGGQVTLRDLGSSNGTYLRIRGEVPVVRGDLIRMGDELLRFELG